MAVDDHIKKNYKECEFCGRPLPARYGHALCPECLDAQLFRDVKEYIRSNTVNEYDVAAHFQIPLKRVKNWIRDGRIEYRLDTPTGNIAHLHCQKCGAPVTFGSLCPKCLKQLNGNKGFSSQKQTDAESRMRFLDSNKSKKEGQ